MNRRPSTVRVGVHGTWLSGVRPERRRASAVATLKVEPGAYRPVNAVSAPSPPGPLETASSAPVDGRIATIALAGPTSVRIRSAAPCRSGSVRVVVDGQHLHAGGAAQLLVVARLQPGQPHRVARADGTVGRLDDLCGGLADGSEQRLPERPRRGQRQRALDGQ